MIMHGRRVKLSDGRTGRICRVINPDADKKKIAKTCETWVVAVDNGGLVPTTPSACELIDKQNQEEIKSQKKKIQ